MENNFMIPNMRKPQGVTICSKKKYSNRSLTKFKIMLVIRIYE